MGGKKPTSRVGEDDDSPAASEGGTESKESAMIIDDDEYSVGTELSEEPKIEEVEKVVVGGKKKGKTGNKKDDPGEEEDEEEENDVSDVSVPEFTGKKKSKSKVNGAGIGFSGTAFRLIDEDGEEEGENLDVVEDEPVLSFSGTQKPSKKGEKGGSSFTSSAFDAIDDDANGGELIDNHAEEDDDNVGEKGGVGGNVESAAAKKKRKKKEREKQKKEREKEKKAAASETKEEVQAEAKTETTGSENNDPKSKVAEKKVPKHVREKQEEMARRQEAAEKKKREEEEKLRKEEEERLRLEELERQAEEVKRRKKESEKEKLLRKKLEGKLLTGKQKEEARRREAMRNQILAGAPDMAVLDKESAPSKRPIYKTKKPKQVHNQANRAAPEKVKTNIDEKEKQIEQPELEANCMGTVSIQELESVNVGEKAEIDNTPQGEKDDEVDEWDAKSWDDVNLNIKGAFDDEEVDSEAEPLPVVKKETQSSAPSSSHTAPIAIKKAQHVGNKESQLDPEVLVKDKRKDPKGKASVSIEVPEQGEGNLRSPICCIMGHVDTGKTKLLDCIRGTNVQEGEAGGITQQIGATYFPAENIRERTKALKADAKLKVPGLLVIDTPGHESFTNLRSRGSGLCDIAILVVDIMHGLEPQTVESLNLLKMRNTEFIIALNKVDRLYGWKTCRNAPIRNAFRQQSKDVINEFNHRLTGVITEFQEQGLNTKLYYKNREMGETYSIVPTSAISGEGIPDILLLLVQWTQRTMVEKLTFSNKVQCTVLEVKVIEGHGTTIDVVLVNGILQEGDEIVVSGLQGAIVTTIRALLTPHPMKELRVKGTYLHHKEIKAAQGIKISAQGLEHAIAGTSLYVVGVDDILNDFIELADEDMKSVMNRIDKSGEGVYVQASTLGSLEALLEFLKSPAVKIPVSGIGIGPIHKKDVMKASVMLERKKEYATILAFDVKVTPEARVLADKSGVKIFCADIIYHLFDQFKAYIDNIKEEKKKDAAEEAVFPCVLKILPNCIFNKKDPIVLGVDILEGILKVGTPICIPQRDFIDIGRIASIENNHKNVDTAKKGDTVAIKIVGSNADQQQITFGRHFDEADELVSHITRASIDVLKENYREELSKEEWILVVKQKNLFKIQ